MKLFFYTLLGLTLFASTSSAQEQTIVELASFETRYGDFGRYRGRAHNIRLAASLVSETVLQPGESLSFNTKVGERTRERGFREAPVILSGRVSEGYGGGICQVASTIHAAALYSGLTITEHHPHTRVSSYIRPGLDATVDWSTEKDLVIENPLSFPVLLQVTTYEGSQSGERFIVAKIFAKQKTNEVRVRFFEIVTERFETVEQVDDDLQAGERIIREPGTNGMSVTVRRTITALTGDSRPVREQRYTIYPPSDRIVLVGSENE